MDSRQLPDPRIRASFRRRCAPKRVARAVRDRKGSQGSLARRALCDPLTVIAQRLRIRPVGPGGLPRRDARLFQRPRGLPLSRRPRRRTVRGRDRRRREAAPGASLARRDDAAARGRGTPGLRHLPRGELRRTDRPPGRDGGLRARVVRGRVARAHDIAITGRIDADLDRAGARPRARLPVADRSVRRRAGSRAPFERYLFQVAAVGDGYGGLEHRASTSLLCKRDELPRPGVATDHRRLPPVSRAREPRIFPQLERQADQAGGVRSLRPRPRELHAAAVGLRGHHVVLRRPRAGAERRDRPQSYLELLGRTITTVLRNPGRHVQSVADSSFDAWIKYYRRDENTPNAVVSYYAEGLARRARARSHAARSARIIARRADARAVAALRPDRHRRAGGRHRDASRASSPATTSAASSRATCDGTDDPPLARSARRTSA